MYPHSLAVLMKFQGGSLCNQILCRSKACRTACQFQGQLLQVRELHGVQRMAQSLSCTALHDPSLTLPCTSSAGGTRTRHAQRLRCGSCSFASHLLFCRVLCMLTELQLSLHPWDSGAMVRLNSHVTEHDTVCTLSTARAHTSHTMTAPP